MEGWRHTYGDRMGPTPEEAEHARLVLLWGTNTLTSNPHLWPALRRARERGARLIAIDPIRTRTAAQCDEHLPIRPGTDAALALGMMHVILRDRLEDRDYLERYTVGWELLPERVAEWTPERGPRRSRGWTAAEIEALAREYALARPSFIRLNYGLQRHAGGAMAVRAVSLLPALTGAWRDEGGGATLSTSGAFRMSTARAGAPGLDPGRHAHHQHDPAGRRAHRAGRGGRRAAGEGAGRLQLQPRRGRARPRRVREGLRARTSSPWCSSTSRPTPPTTPTGSSRRPRSWSTGTSTPPTATST
jgi:anaerobic selenocysteine-containing dehydrogenase